MRLPHTVAALLVATTVASGCAAPQLSAQRQREDMAWYAQDSVGFARTVTDAVDQAFVAGNEKSALLARAAILAHHAKEQKALAQADGANAAGGSEASTLTLADLRARNDALHQERMTLEREWDVWQVQQGVKKADATELIYDRRQPGC